MERGKKERKKEEEEEKIREHGERALDRMREKESISEQYITIASDIWCDLRGPFIFLSFLFFFFFFLQLSQHLYRGYWHSKRSSTFVTFDRGITGIFSIEIRKQDAATVRYERERAPVSSLLVE